MLGIKFPAMHKIVATEIPDHMSQAQIAAAIDEQLEQALAGKDITGKRVGVLAGSRGIRNIQFIIKQVIDKLKQHGAKVAVLPAMGSHGGATAEGQRAILDHYGINERELGVPIISNMQVARVGDIDGHPVYVDQKALEMDYIVPVNRVKAHTDFHGEHESGIAKMLVIGIGKRAQAEAVHQHGAGGLRRLIPQVARKVLENVSLLAAVAIVENKLDETALIEVLQRDNLFAREQELLKLSRDLLPKLPAKNLDVLVVKEMGKNISGVGIDPNVTGRMRINGVPDEEGTAKRIAVLDLTAHSDGNALGMGIADVITRRLYDKVDINKTYINTITSVYIERCFIPVIAPTDKEAVRIALQTCGRVVNADNTRMMIIKNTLDLSEIYVSQALLPEIPSGYEISADKVDELFDEAGNLLLL